MATLFEFLGAINTGDKIDLNPDNPYKEYVPFQINSGLSQHLDTVLLANEMNKRPWITKEMQFKFFASAVSKKRRFGKWAKADNGEDNEETIDVLCEHYEVNRTIARTYLKILTAEELTAIMKMNKKGGSDTVRKVGKPKK